MARLALLPAGVPPHATTPLFDVPTIAGMETVVIEAGAPFDEVLAAVEMHAPTHLVGYASVIGRLARASLAGDLRLRLSRVSTNSEPLLPEDRDAIVNARIECDLHARLGQDHEHGHAARAREHFAIALERERLE